jgi:hypothetical protein
MNGGTTKKRKSKSKNNSAVKKEKKPVLKSEKYLKIPAARRTLSDQKKLVLALLQEANFPTNTSRANVFRKGQTSYKGFVLGIINLRGNMHATHGKTAPSSHTRGGKFKKLHQESKRLLKMHDPKFKFTSIQFNKNQQAAKHKDSRNVGVSYIIGLGKYTGGKLVIWDENDKNPKENNLRNRFLSFNGSKRFHEVTPYKGERYTLVYYKV